MQHLCCDIESFYIYIYIYIYILYIYLYQIKNKITFTKLTVLCGKSKISFIYRFPVNLMHFFSFGSVLSGSCLLKSIVIISSFL